MEFAKKFISIIKSDRTKRVGRSLLSDMMMSLDHAGENITNIFYGDDVGEKNVVKYYDNSNTDLKSAWVHEHQPALAAERDAYDYFVDTFKDYEQNHDLHSMTYTDTEFSDILIDKCGASVSDLDLIQKALIQKLTKNYHISHKAWTDYSDKSNPIDKHTFKW